jgi:hypothetical protein
LEAGVHVDALLFHVLGEVSLGVLAWLHEEHQNTSEELDAWKRGETHEKEDTQKNRDRELLEQVQEKHGHTQKEVGKQHGKTGFLDTDEFSFLVLLGKGVQVDDAGNSGGNQPGKSQKSIDAVEKSIQAKIIVVSFTVGQLVVLVHDQVPSDAVVKVAQKEGHDSRSSSSKNSPSWNTTQVNKPTTSSSGSFLFWAFIGPESDTFTCATGIGGLKLTRDVKLFSVDIIEEEVLNKGPEENRHGDSKIMDGSTAKISTEVR